MKGEVKVLVSAHSSHRLGDQVKLCTKINNFNPLIKFHFVLDAKLGSKGLEQVKNANIDCSVIGKIGTKKSTKNKIESVSLKQRIFKKLPFLERLYLWIKYHFIYYFIEKRASNSLLNKWNDQYKILEEIYDQFKPDLLLVNGDRNLGIEPLFLKLKKEKKIKTFVPYLVYAHEEAPLVLRKGRREKMLFPKGPLLNTIIKNKYPKQFLRYKEDKKKYMFYSPSVLWALEQFGVLSPNPWYVGNGRVDYVILDSKEAKERYVENGVKDEKLKILGDFAQDQLYEVYTKRSEYKAQLAEKYKLDKSKPVWVIALPQLAEHDLLDWETHWIYQNQIVEEVSKKGFNILLSLHPRMKKEQYEFLEEKYNCKILEERLFDILPIADAFIATYSSTVRWAVLCEIPTLIVDFTNINHKMFNNFEAIKICKNYNDYMKEIQNWNPDGSLLKQDSDKLSKSEIFNGKTIERYSNFLKSIIDERE